jgi:transcriptional regulator with XRE-family HTH domain
MWHNIRQAYDDSQADYTRGAVPIDMRGAYDCGMAQQKHFLREWREFRDKTQDQVSEHLEILSHDPRFMRGESPAKVGKTQATLQRIESGVLPYNQTLLEMLAEVYSTDAASLIIRNPLAADPIWSIWDRVPVQRREEALRLLSVFADDLKKTA